MNILEQIFRLPDLMPPIEESPNSGRSGFLNAREPPEKVESPRLRRPPNHSSNDSAVAFSRVQYCLGKAVQCDRLALDSTHPDMKFIYRDSKNSKANRIETGERSGGIGEFCSVEVDEK